MDPHGHCLDCFRSACSFEGCLLGRCGFCSARLHECKREDHLEICQNVVVPCINAIYGCRRRFARHFQKTHLATCPASVVVCHLQWNRSALSDSAKKQIKRAAKGFPTEIVPKTDASGLDDNDLDVIGCILDQKKIVDFFKLRRNYRISFRDYFTPTYPVLPLLAHKDRPNEESAEFHDSSDDEKKAEAEKIRKKMLPWANCYICKIDPASQHLHVLGNLTNEKKREKPANGATVKDTLFVPEFYRQRGLMLTKTFHRLAGSVKKGAMIFEVGTKGRPLFTFQCAEVVRRTEIEDHARFHELEDNEWHMHRCPMWSEGCDFATSNMDPKEGRFRYCDFLGKVVHEPTPSSSASLDDFHEETFYRVLPLLADYVDSASLRTLSATSRRARVFLENARQRIVTVPWRRTEDFYGNVFWEEEAPQYSYTKCQRLLTVTPTVPGDFWAHFASCAFRKAAEPECPEKLRTFLLLIQTKE
ncbi:hypothetical protein QR680_016710 [Steinernema hermaphroditum]|uniref:TRAF-type domain-containing protein n=1 Tax=Steinernema hermaphroditum TaxID=289476 RepID=A0AA39LN06_9BILA|nr:hypothetical protein QR680_016710 [Steinernema hermaphroditum]